MKRSCMFRCSSIIAVCLFSVCAAEAESLTVQVNKVSAEGIGEPAGTLVLSDSPQGLNIKSSLSNLPPGTHGFHVHENGSCEPALKDGKQTPAASAGAHFAHTGQDKHAGPEGIGHVGDLPFLTVDQDGKSSQTLIAPRLKVEDVKGRSFIIHEGGDNYSDSPEPLGGGRGRIACGVAK